MEGQIENAIEIAINPRADPNLKSQAFEFVNRLREDPTAWQACLPLFTRIPRAPEVVRHYSLEIISNAVQTQNLDEQSLNYLKEQLMNYIRQQYSGQEAHPDDTSTTIRNKLSQTFTYLFGSLYTTSWPSFFDDFQALLGDDSALGVSTAPTTALYLRIQSSIHDEYADVLVSRTDSELKKSGDLKDAMRARDVPKVATFWQKLLGKWRQIDLGLVELCLKTIGRWVNWIDISLVVNENLVPKLLEVAGQPGTLGVESLEARARNTAIDTFTEIVAKKMKPAEKIELIEFLNLNTIAGQLLASPPLAELRSTPDYDTDLAETVAKLVNSIVFDIVKVLDDGSVAASTRSRADALLVSFVPYLLRLFSDEYDEICSTVIPALTDVLTYLRKLIKSSGQLPAQYSAMLQPILDAIIAKMRYDETASWGTSDDETDEAEFDELRKRLRVLMQTVSVIDENLVINTASTLVSTIFKKLGAGDSKLMWQDLDLALHVMYLFGELASKNAGLYAKSKPSSLASERLIGMMEAMVQSNVASFNHPAVQLQYMEICVRYCQFFEHNAQFVIITLESFVRLVHSNHQKVKLRSWYLFLRYVKHLRAQLSSVSQDVLRAVGDLLVIKAEAPKPTDDEDDMSSDDNINSPDTIFDSQLYLFEAIGSIASTNAVSTENKLAYARMVVDPLLNDLQQHMAKAKAGDEQAVMQIHHIMGAIGKLAIGFVEVTPGSKISSTPTQPPEIVQVFAQASEAILATLESLNGSLTIRSAARQAFSRMLGVLGMRVLDQLPRWINGLLSQSSSRDEMSTFLRMLVQIIHGLGNQCLSILDSLLMPLMQRVYPGLSEPVSGTDDEIQLAELRREYLNFILALLRDGLAQILVSNTNQASFESIISTIEHFARDTADYPTARLALGVLIQMCSVWGGPDVAKPTSATVNGSAPTPNEPAPALPGFDQFMITRFSPLTWSIPALPNFNSKDPQARQLLSEIAALQQAILAKTGAAYIRWLQDSELKGVGLDGAPRDQYLQALTKMDQKAFRQYFLQLIAPSR